MAQYTAELSKPSVLHNPFFSRVNTRDTGPMTQLINNSGYPLLEVCHWNLKTLTLHKTILSCILRLFRTELPMLSNNILTKLIRFPAKGTISLLKEIFLSGVHLPGNPSRCAITAGDPSVRLCSSAILACKSAWGHQGQKHVKPHPHELNSLQCSHHKSLLSDLGKLQSATKLLRHPSPPFKGGAFVVF